MGDTLAHNLVQHLQRIIDERDQYKARLAEAENFKAAAKSACKGWRQLYEIQDERLAEMESDSQHMAATLGRTQERLAEAEALLRWWRDEPSLGLIRRGERIRRTDAFLAAVADDCPRRTQRQSQRSPHRR